MAISCSTLNDCVEVYHLVKMLAAMWDAHEKDKRWAVCGSSSWSPAQWTYGKMKLNCYGLEAYWFFFFWGGGQNFDLAARSRVGRFIFVSVIVEYKSNKVFLFLCTGILELVDYTGNLKINTLRPMRQESLRRGRPLSSAAWTPSHGEEGVD